MKQFWEERYAEPEYAYGVAPNQFLKEQLERFAPGTILFPADGEGRNSVYAATQGWEVSAFDMSQEGKKKADALAAEHGVAIDFKVGLIQELEYPKESFDALVLIYAHFPPEHRKAFHQRLAGFLKPGGVLILEGFSKEHLAFSEKNPKAGGPKNVDMLFSIEELQEDFNGFDFLECCGQTIELNEGLYHVGDSSVIRLVARKR